MANLGRHKMILGTGAGIRARHAYSVGLDLGMPFSPPHDRTDYNEAANARGRDEEVSNVVQPAIKEQVLNDLERLSPEQQKRAAELVHGLLSTLPKGTPGRDLLRFAGTLDDESASEMTAAIEEGCERVDLDEW